MNRAAHSRQSDSQYGKSKIQILKTAEMLMATKGVYATSLREINQEANQKNASSVHYHFKDREGLIRAVLESHIAKVERQRTLMLQSIKSDYPILDSGDVSTLSEIEKSKIIRRLINILIGPLAEKLHSQSGRNYLKILQEIVFSGKTDVGGAKTPQTFDDLINFTKGIRTATGYILKLAPEFPGTIVIMRGKIIARMIISALADLIPEIDSSGQIYETSSEVDLNRDLSNNKENINLDLVIENLTDVILAIISSPVSELTLTAVRNSGLD